MIYMYSIVKIIEILVIVLCGFRLLTQTFDLRWEYWRTKVLLGLGLVGLAVVLLRNGMMFSFSVIDYILGFFCCLILSAVFYEMKLLQAIVYNFLYWQNMLLLHFVILVVSGVLEEVDVASHISDPANVSVTYIIGMCIIICIILYLYKIRQGKEFIGLKGKRNYICLFCLQCIEWVAINGLLTKDMMLLSKDWRNAVVAASFLVVVVSIGIVLIIYNSYVPEESQIKLLELNQNMVKKQYDYVQESYDDKRRQVHNALHQYTLLKEYLVLGKLEEACYYLDELQDKSKRIEGNRDTGISSIDFIISFKRKEAEKRNVQILTDINAFSCPFERDDLCVLLGNLMDNAIEASKILMKGQRQIFLKIWTANNIFLLKIENKYIGERKISDGNYKTTKGNDEIHGLGIESCRMIVEQYNGTFEIEDDGETFRVEVTIFQDGKK